MDLEGAGAVMGKAGLKNKKGENPIRLPFCFTCSNGCSQGCLGMNNSVGVTSCQKGCTITGTYAKGIFK